MDRVKIRTIDLENFKAIKDSLNYYDTNVIAFKSKNIDSYLEDNIKLNCFLIVYCFDGELEININSKDYILNKENSAVLLPGTILRKTKTKYPHPKADNSITLLGFSTSFLSDTIHLKKETINIAFQLFKTPILPCTPIESYKFYIYKELAYILFNETNHLYREEILKHFFATIFCEMLSEISKVIPEQSHEYKQKNKRSDWIFRKFIELVLKDDGSHRSVSYYANQLCYSPKHVSTVIKQISGTSPLKLINDHAIKQIKFQLKHSGKSMKEIADEFNFANPSFFGKFVKQHIGMSPLQYRNSQENQIEEFQFNINT